MSEENPLALRLHLESPIFMSKDGTDRAYNENLIQILSNFQEGDVLCVGTHNDESVELAR